MGIITEAGRRTVSGRHKEALDLLEKGNVRDAVVLLADLAESDPLNPDICVDLGKAVMILGMVDQAVIAARQAIELDSMNQDAFMLLAHALEAKGEYADACQALRRALDMRRNPLAPIKELEGEKVPLPLSIPEYGAIFIDFEILGDSQNLSLQSTSGCKKYRINMAIAGNAPVAVDDAFDFLAKGSLPRERVLQSLPDNLSTAISLFASSSFDYTLQKKRG